MSQRVQLPPGCAGFRCADGSVYSAKAGTSVVLEDRHAKALSSSQHSSIGLVTAGESFSLGTKQGRVCDACSRVWQAWSLQCPKCGAETRDEWTGIELVWDDDAASTENSPYTTSEPA